VIAVPVSHSSRWSVSAQGSHASDENLSPR
jgi:hypothetical protein